MIIFDNKLNFVIAKLYKNYSNLTVGVYEVLQCCEVTFYSTITGSFETASEESLVLKKFCQLEHTAFTQLFGDPLYKYIPKYHGITIKDGHRILYVHRTTGRKCTTFTVNSGA